MGRERRRRSRRSSTSRSLGQAISGQATAVPGTPAAEASSTRGAATPAAPPAHVRSDRVLARESQTMLDEMKRVFLVSGVCFGMLIVLVVVERLQ